MFVCEFICNVKNGFEVKFEFVNFKCIFFFDVGVDIFDFFLVFCSEDVIIVYVKSRCLFI